MEKKSSQIENCCENMLKSKSPMMQQMKEFMSKMSKEEGENEKKSCRSKNIEKFAENMCC